MTAQDIERPGPVFRTQKRGEAKRRAILEAAAEEFSAKGFEGGSMRSIARTLGVELAHIQTHFRNKEILWSAVLGDVIGAFRRGFDELLEECDGRPPDETLARFIESLIGYSVHNPAFVAIMAQPRNDPSAKTLVYERELGPGLKKVLVLIAQAQAQGRFVRGDPGLLFYHMAGASVRIFSAISDARAIIGRDPLDPRTIADHTETCVALFMPHRGRATGAI